MREAENEETADEEIYVGIWIYRTKFDPDLYFELVANHPDILPKFK